MSLSRRSVMFVSTLGFAAMFAGGFTWRAYSRGVFGVDGAYAPWREWQHAPLDGPLAIARAGLLASNVQNSQPWLFEVESGRIALYADRRRHAGTIDPFRREMQLSLGCALANMEIAARAQGFAPTIGYVGGRLDEGVAPSADNVGGLDPKTDAASSLEPLHVATLYLAPGGIERGALFEAIAARHTNRSKYDADRPVPLSLQALMEQETAADGPPVRLMLFVPGAPRDRLAALIEASAEAIRADREMAADAARWFRIERETLLEQRDGIAFETTSQERFLGGALQRLFETSEPEEPSGSWPQTVAELYVRKAPLLGAIAVRDLYDKESTLAAGRLWQRLHLLMTAHGVAAQPLNQPVQLGDRDLALGRPPAARAQLDAIVGDGWQPTLLFRAGYATEPASASPRRALETVMMA